MTVAKQAKAGLKRKWSG